MPESNLDFGVGVIRFVNSRIGIALIYWNQQVIIQQMFGSCSCKI